MKRSYYILCFFSLWLSASCMKKDDYKKFLEGGELAYPARPDSITTYPGNNRLLLSWVLKGDPNLEGYKISWNQGADSIEHSLKDRNGSTDTIRLWIDKDVAEGTYTFTIYSFDHAGNLSIPSEVTAKTYGENYQSRLPGNRQILQVKNSSDSVFITWDAAPPDNIFTELHYITVEDVEKTIRIPAGSPNTVLADYKFSSDILYKSGFIPDSNAIDTFYIPVFDTARYVP